MSWKLLTFAAAAVLMTATVTACDRPDADTVGSGSSTSVGKGNGRARVGVILPDTTSAQRWSTADPKFLKEAFAARNVPVEIENAHGDRDAFVQIARNMIGSGVRVLIIASIDSASGRQALAAAKAEKIPTIDYDRLTLGGGADYYVSFDNRKIGQFQAAGLSRCLQRRARTSPVIAELNGAPADNNATMFKSGYDEFLDGRYDDGTFIKGPDQSVPDWKPEEAETIFAQMLAQRPDIGGVLAANDGIAGAVIKVLKKHKLNGKVPVTGQDASVPGLQALLTGDQCMTVYKPIQPEAGTAARLAIQLFQGERPRVTGQTKDPESGAYVPTIAIDPTAITVGSIKTVVNQKFASVKDICTAPYAELCRTHGLIK
jgi:D-xylose transport system substrate-binding protein